MAALRFGLALVCALLISQVTSSPWEVHNVQQNPLANQTQQLIVNITTFLDKLIDDVSRFSKNMSKDGLDGFQKETVAITYKVLGAVKNFLDKEFDRVYDQLNNNAQKVSKCIKSHGNDFIKVIVDFYDKTSICFNPALKPVLGALDPLLADLKKVDEGVAALAPGLSKCENDLCVFGVLAKVLQEVLNLSDVLHKDLPPILNLAKALLNTAKTCALKEADPWRKEFIQMFNAAATCYRS